MAEKRFLCVVITGLCLMCYIFLYERAQVEKETPVYSEHKKTVALTFDDGPNYRTTKMLLDGLRDRGIRATFFLVGNRIEGNEDLILRMHMDGHVIGNHTFTHADLTGISEEAALEEVSKTNAIIQKITGEEVKFIRPPCGYWNDELMKKVDLTPVFWSVDPLDWQTVNAGVVVDRVVGDVNDGDIILFHDIYESSVVAALEVVDRLMDMGYVFVTVDEILQE